MTDLQDLLLDKLVGSPIGKGWKDGPFRVAAELVPGKRIRFTGQHDDAPAKNAIAGRLGYPRMLLEAAQGAVSVLKAEDDRRSFAMTLLGAIPPGTKQKPRPLGVYRLAAVAVTRRAHALACPGAKCGVKAVLDRVLAADPEEERDQAIDPLFKATCPAFGKDIDLTIRIAPKTPAVVRTIYAAVCCAGAYWDPNPHHDANRAAREACRAAALVGGVEEAVALCVELARRLGMQAR
jgi:hypothetical protein